MPSSVLDPEEASSRAKMNPKEIPGTVIHDEADLELRLYIHSDNQYFQTAGPSGKAIKGKLMAKLLVCKDIVTRGNPDLEKFLEDFFSRTNQNETVDIVEYNLTGLETCLRALHGTCVQRSFELSVDEMWDVLEAGLRYSADITILKDWMRCWYHNCKDDLVKTEDLEKLVIPFRRVEFAVGLMEVTKKLAYEKAVKICLYNPEMKSGELSCEPRLEGGLNAARVDLGHKLFDYIEETIKKIVHSNCECRPFALLSFFQGLDRTGMLPLHKRLQGKDAISIKDAIKSLKFFKYEKPPNACFNCSQNFGSKFYQHLDNVLKNFKGICLDCVMEPLELNGEPDREQFWDLGCEVPHDQPSWYFSWLASEMGDCSVLGEPINHTAQGQGKREKRHNRLHVSGKPRFQKRWMDKFWVGGCYEDMPGTLSCVGHTIEIGGDVHKSKSSFTLTEPFYLETIIQPSYNPLDKLDELSPTSKPIAESSCEWTQRCWPPVIKIPQVAPPQARAIQVSSRSLPREFQVVAWSKMPASMLFYRKHRLHIVVSLPPAEKLRMTDLKDAYQREGMSLLTRLLNVSFG